MEPTAALALLGLGALLGGVGQGARVIVGLKKDWQAASSDERAKELGERDEELHQEIKKLVAREKELDKANTDTKTGSQGSTDNPTAAERKGIAERKGLLLTERAMVLEQRRGRRWFSSGELLISLLISFVIGAMAGILAGMSFVEADSGIDQKTMLTIVGAGYAGTDFIEGFMKSNLPK